MALPMTYARRKRLREEAGKARIFRSRPFGQKLLTQLYQSISSFDAHFDYKNRITDNVVVELREEIGILSLANERELKEDFRFWWFNEHGSTTEEEHDYRITAIEFACQFALEKASEIDRKGQYSRSVFDRALYPTIHHIVQTINARMMEDSFGFQFQRGQMVEITSEFAHEEIVEPALDVLANPIFEAANIEFRSAFEEFKQRQYDDCIADCGNAFESVMKVIAAQKRWTDVSENDPAAKLIEALYRNELIPTWMGEQLKGLRMMLQGVATVRNKEASHGAGEEPREVSRHLAAYQLHQTAAAIVFLAEQAGL